MPNVYSASAARHARKPHVITLHGTLNPVALARSPVKKKVFWAALQGRAVREAALLHATSDEEYHHIRKLGLRQPVAVIPNGIDVPALPKRERAKGPRRLLYLGRLHPIKGLEDLLQAWGRSAAPFEDWELRLVGPGEKAYVARLQRLASDLDLPRVSFAGPSYGADKSEEYRRADLYVLPSLTENFGMSVAEALAHGLPVITTRGTPWRGLEDQDCGWWIEGGADSMGQALGKALAMDRASLSAMGARGRQWMLRDYSWDSVALALERAYQWLLQGGAPPDVVHLS